MSKILISRVIALDEYSLSRRNLTRFHRRLKGFTLNSLHSASPLSWALQCQMNPRCVFKNFRKFSTFEETGRICELKSRGIMLPQAIKGRKLARDEETFSSQFYDRKVRKMCYYDI